MVSAAAAKARYREIGPLAQGGMADLCCAVDERGGRVVIKRIRPNLVFDATYRGLFQDEGELAARLDHPNIVRLLDRGEDECGPFLVFEQVDGTDLAIVLEAHMQQERPLDLASTLAIFIPLLRGLHAAHEAQGAEGELLELVHRDVSPGNVLLSDDGDVKLADFGVAKSRLKTDETVAGEMKGKFAYMAPEQTRNDGIDRRADLFAVGILLFECLTGRRLFDGPTDADIVHAVREQAPPNPAEDLGGLPEELAGLIAHLLAKSPGERPQTAAEVAQELQDVATSQCLETGLRRHVARLAKLHPRPAPEEDARPRVSSGPKRRTQKVVQPDLGVARPRPKRSWAPWVAGAGVILFLATVGFSALRPATSNRPPPVVIERLPDSDLGTGAAGNPSAERSAPDESKTTGAAAAPDESPPQPAGARELPRVSFAGSSARKGKLSTTERGRTPPPRARQAATGSGSRAQGSVNKGPAATSGFGKLYLNSKPWANVKVDGADLGKDTPLVGVRLPAGPHELTLENPHFGLRRTIRVVVPKDGQVRENVDLTKR